MYIVRIEHHTTVNVYEAKSGILALSVIRSGHQSAVSARVVGNRLEVVCEDGLTRVYDVGRPQPVIVDMWCSRSAEPTSAGAKPAAPLPATSDIVIVGIGGAGCCMVQEHRRTVGPTSQLLHLAVNTDRSTIVRIRDMPTILLHANASGVEAIQPWLAQRITLYLLAGLGGRTGSLATPTLARLACAAGLQTVALVTMPFEWEGERRRRTATQALEALQQLGIEAIVSHGDAVAASMGDDAPAEECLNALRCPLLQELEVRLK